MNSIVEKIPITFAVFQLKDCRSRRLGTYDTSIRDDYLDGRRALEGMSERQERTEIISLQRRQLLSSIQKWPDLRDRCRSEGVSVRWSYEGYRARDTSKWRRCISGGDSARR